MSLVPRPPAGQYPALGALTAANQGHDGGDMRMTRSMVIGAVVSGAWIVAAATSVSYANIRAGALLRNSAFEVCDFVGYHLRDYPSCWRDLMKMAAVLDHPWANQAAISLGPVLLAWSGMLVSLRLMRWFRASD